MYSLMPGSALTLPCRAVKVGYCAEAGEKGQHAKAQVQVECIGVQNATQVKFNVQPKHVPEIKASPQIDRVWEIDGGGEEFRAGGEGRGTAHCGVGRR